jgi:type IV pilus assembly protein PilO
MDFKDPKIQKVSLAILAFFIVVFFWYSRLYSRYDNEIDLKSQEFETITTNLRNVEMKAKSLEALKVEYGELVTRYHEIEALLPEVKQIPSFLVQLHMASSLTGTKISKVKPLNLTAEEFYNIASFEIEMSGRYHDFGRFISYVANFPFITNVSQMRVEALNVAISAPQQEDKEKKIDNLQQEETMNATFTLSTYFVKEDERLKELVL